MTAENGKCSCGSTEENGTPKPSATWKEVPIGGILPWGGNASRYETGDWRSIRPVYDSDKCIQCRLCWVYCPDSAIEVNEDGEVTGIVYSHCKGCGICAHECPSDGSIEMEPEE